MSWFERLYEWLMPRLGMNIARLGMIIASFGMSK